MTVPGPNCFFVVPVQVRLGPDCDMPSHLKGASVHCFVAAPDYLSALKLAVKQLTGRGYIFEDVVGGNVHQLDPLQWDAYVKSTWPELPDYFPPQDDIQRFISAGGVFFGPFAAWEQDS